MEKNLKDYIQYYIGCRCLNTWFDENNPNYNDGWKLIGFVPDNPKPYGLENAINTTWTDSIKLILRRLEDITDEEAEYIMDTYSFRAVDMPLNERLFAIEIAKRLKEQMGIAHHLRKQDFDLFGLIEAGLAVDEKQFNSYNKKP